MLSLTAIKLFFKSAKFWLYLGLAGILVLSVYAYGGYQYHKGREACQQEYAQAENEQLKQQNQDLAKASKEALETSTKLGKQVAQIQSSKDKETAKAHDNAVKQNRPSACDLSDDELLDFQQATIEANNP